MDPIINAIKFLLEHVQLHGNTPQAERASAHLSAIDAEVERIKGPIRGPGVIVEEHPPQQPEHPKKK